MIPTLPAEVIRSFSVDDADPLDVVLNKRSVGKEEAEIVPDTTTALIDAPVLNDDPVDAPLNLISPNSSVAETAAVVPTVLLADLESSIFDPALPVAAEYLIAVIVFLPSTWSVELESTLAFNPASNRPLESIRSLSVAPPAPSDVVWNSILPGISLAPGVPSTSTLIDAASTNSEPSAPWNEILAIRSLSATTLVAPFEVALVLPM